MPWQRAFTAGVLLLAAAISNDADAFAQRTFVASSGADTNSCAITQPCRSFASAIALTAAGGEVIVLDSAGYGPVTITQSVSIIAPPGVYAGISVLAGVVTGVTSTPARPTRSYCAVCRSVARVAHGIMVGAPGRGARRELCSRQYDRERHLCLFGDWEYQRSCTKHLRPKQRWHGALGIGGRARRPGRRLAICAQWLYGTLRSTGRHFGGNGNVQCAENRRRRQCWERHRCVSGRHDDRCNRRGFTDIRQWPSGGGRKHFPFGRVGELDRGAVHGRPKRRRWPLDRSYCCRGGSVSGGERFCDNGKRWRGRIGDGGRFQRSRNAFDDCPQRRTGFFQFRRDFSFVRQQHAHRPRSVGHSRDDYFEPAAVEGTRAYRRATHWCPGRESNPHGLATGRF